MTSLLGKDYTDTEGVTLDRFRDWVSRDASCLPNVLRGLLYQQCLVGPDAQVCVSCSRA